MDQCLQSYACQKHLNGVEIYLDDFKIGTIAQIDDVQQYTFDVERSGQVVLLNKTTKFLSLAEVKVISLENLPESDLTKAKQSSTYCNITTCYNASRGIDGDDNTMSITAFGTGNHWWSVSIEPNFVVHHVILKAGKGSPDDIIVALYKGVLAGQCGTHHGKRDTLTLKCPKVFADEVVLTVNSSKSVRLHVYKINVVGYRLGEYV